jgi:hypothetical protein
MADIVERLRREVVWESEVGDLLNAAADEIERLRQSDRPQPIETADATPDTNTTPIEGSVQDMCTLTVEERVSIEVAAIAYDREDSDISAVLRHLLERLA